MPVLCEIVTQERLVFSEEVDMVVAPGIEGELGILPNHSPLLTTLKIGELRIRKGGAEEYFAIGGGVLEVRPDKVTVLADVAERAGEIDIARAEEARQRAEEFMEEGPVGEHIDPAAMAEITEALRRSQVRLKVARRRRGPDAMRMGH